MPRGRRNYTVQTPGESQPSEFGERNTEVVSTDVIDIEGARTLTDLETLQAQLAAAQAENAKLRAASGRVEMDGNSKFARTHSSEVDKSTISAPVLCADGWLVP